MLRVTIEFFRTQDNWYTYTQVIDDALDAFIEGAALRVEKAHQTLYYPLHRIEDICVEVTGEDKCDK